MKIADTIPDIATACASMRAALASAAVRPEAPDAEEACGRDGRRGPGPPVRPPIDPGRAPTFVGSGLGLVAKCARDLPRLLRECPPTGREVASTLAALGRVEVAAGGLDEAVRAHALAAPRGGTPARPGVAAGKGYRPARPSKVGVVEALSGPAALGGTYVVAFRLDAGVTIAVGALGTFYFPAGFYCYVGSAFGAGGVRARTGRHLTPVKQKLKWNVDYLTPHARAVAVWWTHDPVRRECLWSAALGASTAFDCPVPEFGARDCRKAPPLRIGGGVYRCPSHLYHSLRPPDVHDFARRLGRLVPGHGVLYRQRLGQIGRPDTTVYPRDTPLAPTSCAGRGRT